MTYLNAQEHVHRFTNFSKVEQWIRSVHFINSAGNTFQR